MGIKRRQRIELQIKKAEAKKDIEKVKKLTPLIGGQYSVKDN